MKMTMTASLVMAIALVALAGVVFGLSAAYAQDSTTTYTVTHVQIDGTRDSVQAVKEANKTLSGASSGHHEFTLDANATDAEILAAADVRSTHSINVNSCYIDASGEVHNFQSGKRTYWLITKSEVNTAPPPDPDPDRQNVGANTLALAGPIADQRLTKDVLYTSAVAFPAATGADGTVTYSVANLPSGITMNSTTRKLTGTATTALTQTTLTYTATDTDTDTATLTFKISVSVAGDYDLDDDGLIEVGNLAQLNAVRWDLDGDGTRLQRGLRHRVPQRRQRHGLPGIQPHRLHRLRIDRRPSTVST